MDGQVPNENLFQNYIKMIENDIKDLATSTNEVRKYEKDFNFLRLVLPSRSQSLWRIQMASTL